MKLTKETKYEIIRTVIKKVFANRDSKIKERENILATAIYFILYPLDIQKKMNALPDNFFNQQSVVYVTMSISKRNRIPIYMQSSRKFSGVDSRGYECPYLELADKDPMIADIIKLQKDKDILWNDQCNMKSKLETLMAGINTKKQLEAEWPEGLIYFKDVLPEENTVNLPAIRGAEITEMINKLK